MTRGVPEFIRSDNGPEFISRAEVACGLFRQSARLNSYRRQCGRYLPSPEAHRRGCYRQVDRCRNLRPRLYLGDEIFIRSRR